jgi:hypothetical protein
MVKLSRVLGLAVAFLVVAVVANCVFAQDETPKKKKGFDPAQMWARIVTAAGAADGTTSLSTADFIKGFSASGRKGAADRAKTIADKIAADGKVTQDAFVKYIKDNPPMRKGKKGGDGGGDQPKSPDAPKTN